MSDTYAKLFSSITESTVWGEPCSTRVVWVTMLAMMDARGEVFGSVPGLTRRANVTREECERALASFMAPDPDSRTPDFEGRRIEPIEGGWRLLNHAKYAAIRDEAERREYKRLWDKQHRPSGHARMSQSDSSPTIRQKSDQSDAPDHTNTNTNTKEQKKEQSARTRAPALDRPESVSPQTWTDWLALRKAKRAPVSETVLRHAKCESEKAGLSLEAFLRIWCGRGSQGLEASWLKPHERGPPAQAPGKMVSAFLALEAMTSNPRTTHGKPSATMVHGPDSERSATPSASGSGSDPSE